jgi:phosphatidylglycerophosphate synthase
MSTSSDTGDRGLPTSIAELRRVTQPPEVRLRANAEHWTAHLYLRDLSPYLTWLLLRTRISANGVTVVMILTGWAAAAALLIPGIGGAALALVLGQLQMLVDCCDGEVARWRRTSSPVGHFLDAVGHYSTETLIALALGIRAAAYPFEAQVAFALALVMVLNKALNDMVRVARASADLPKAPVGASTVASQQSLIAVARRAVRFLPFHRMFHSVELTIVVFAVALVGLVAGQPATDRVLLVALVPLAVLALVGHFVMIVTSRRLTSA